MSGEHGEKPEKTPTGPVAIEQDPDMPAYQPDIAALQQANGDPAVWGHEMFELIQHTTGFHISEESLTSWFASFSAQIVKATFRSALFQVANTPLPSSVQGDPALLLLQLRDDLAGGLKHAGGF